MTIVLKAKHRAGRTETALSSCRCSRKQKQLLLRYLKKCHLDQSVIERIAQERFGKALQTLNRSQARKLILLPEGPMIETIFPLSSVKFK